MWFVKHIYFGNILEYQSVIISKQMQSSGLLRFKLNNESFVST